MLMPHLALQMVNKTYLHHQYGSLANMFVLVHIIDYKTMLRIMKSEYSQIASTLCMELIWKFPDAKSMVAFGMVYS
jgi:hypothetical protein